MTQLSEEIANIKRRSALKASLKAYRNLINSGMSNKEALAITEMTENDLKDAIKDETEAGTELGSLNDIPIRLKNKPKIPHEEYYLRLGHGTPFQYERDILEGKIHISEVHIKYRTFTAYLYAFRWTRSLCEVTDEYVELKALEQLLLQDIMEVRHLGHPERCKELSRAYFEIIQQISNVLKKLAPTGYTELIKGQTSI